MSLCRADVMVVLLCVAALLPDQPTAGEVSADALASVDASCNRLLGVALLVSAPLQVLHDALSRGGGAGGVAKPRSQPWREFVKSRGNIAVATGSREDAKVPYLMHPLHTSQYGLLLQVSIEGKWSWPHHGPCRREAILSSGLAMYLQNRKVSIWDLEACP